ncbi:adenylate/guanylate cyclase domain-containing protein [Roseibium sp.]|uniref:adenylate/guanylate cyclase domain-containing protein n=1 Tax=Roseibium sp. TaxID=1936156 RepID=UPI003A980A78
MAFSLKRKYLKMPLSRIVSFAFGGFVAISISLILFLSVKANVQNTFSLLNDKAILLSTSMEQRVRDHFYSVEQAVTDLKPFFDRGEISFSDQDTGLDMMKVAVATSSRITVLVATDLNGENFGVYQAPSGRLWPFKRQLPPGSDKTYVLPKLNVYSGPTWGPILNNDVGQFANVSVPLVIKGKLIGTLTAASSLDSLAKAIRSLDEGDESTTFVMVNGDEILVHSDKDEFQVGGKALQPLPAPREEFGDPVLANMDTADKLDGFAKAARLGINVSRIEVGKREFIVMKADIPGYSTEPWVIGQYFRGASITREVERLTGSALVGIGAMIIAVLVALWMGRVMARPLKKLAEQSRAVATLSLDNVEPLPRSRVAELDQVAQAFNSMVVGLRAMNTYVPRSLFNKLMRLGGSQAAEAREARLTILFTDIVGFTAMSETMSAGETARYLNAHFAVLVSGVEEEGGTVDKFVGDGMLAFWGAPDARADHAMAAVRAARRISRDLEDFNSEAAERGDPTVRIRIGIHTGPAVVGNVGALDRWNYTVVGDTVNVTERLQTLGRELGAEDKVVILVSSDTIAELYGEQAAERAGDFSLRGRSEPMEVFKLDPYASPTEDQLVVRSAFSTTAAE